MGKVEQIIKYLRNPKVVGEFHGSTLDGMLKVDFSTDTLRDMIEALSEKELNKLLEDVGTVCAQWSALRVAPNNDIGTVARYQEANLIIEALVASPKPSKLEKS